MSFIGDSVKTANQALARIWKGKEVPPFTKGQIMSRARLSELAAWCNALSHGQVRPGTTADFYIERGAAVWQVPDGTALPGATGTGGIIYRGPYDSGTDYNVNDLVYTSPDSNTRVPYICEIANGPSTSVQAPTWPEPGTIYWRDVARFFFRLNPPSGNVLRPALNGIVNAIAIDSVTGDIYACGSFDGLTVTDGLGNTRSGLRNGVCAFTDSLNPMPASWLFQDAGGSVDPNGNFKSSGNPRALAVNSSNQIFVLGNFDTVNTISCGTYPSVLPLGIARINPDGTADESWAVVSLDNTPDCCFLDSDKLVAGGVFTGNIVRYNTDGTVDGAFTPPGFGTVLAMIAGGRNYCYTGLPGEVRALDSAGATDGGFSSGAINYGGGPGSIFALAHGPSLGVYVGGQFTSVNGTSTSGLVRLNSVGALDGAFAPTINTEVAALAIDAGGKIVVGGNFSSVNGVTRYGLCRLNTDGTTDSSFTAECNAGGSVYAVAIKSNGEIIVGGNFTDISGVSRVNIARLSTTGEVLGI